MGYFVITENVLAGGLYDCVRCMHDIHISVCEQNTTRTLYGRNIPYSSSATLLQIQFYTRKYA